MSLAADINAEQLLADLYKAAGKAEIVDGRIVVLSPPGDLPSSAAGFIYASLLRYARIHGGRAYTDNAAFFVNLPNRKSFSPDAAYYTGARTQAKFLDGAPVFAVKVRSQANHGPAEDRKRAAKRADYIAAGTKVVWDVDVLRDEVVGVSRADSAEQPTIYRRGEFAEAEPAVPGWKFSVDEPLIEEL